MDKRDECGCHRNCITITHECEKPCIWPNCLTEEEAQELTNSIDRDFNGMA